MIELIDKIVLLISSSVLYFYAFDNTYILVPIIIAVILSCLNTYLDHPRFSEGSFLFFLTITMFYPKLLIFLPILLYDITFTKEWRIGLLSLFPFLYHSKMMDYQVLTFVILLFLISIIGKYKTSKVTQLLKEYYELRDTSKEVSLLLEEKNRNLLEKQDYEINMATLNERNRISKEIHDNIGHLLSRSLIQIGALLTISKEEVVKEGLASLKKSISDGMDSIRESIHNIHNESIDLYTYIQTLLTNFTFCKSSFHYDVTNAPCLNMKYCIISTIKESLSNIIKHSNATYVNIQIVEHPIMYQIIIEDNGTVDDEVRKQLEYLNNGIKKADGMGLQNIIDRVRGFDGIYHISAKKGFRIFITLPKKSMSTPSSSN